jgi:hypothetical protein
MEACNKYWYKNGNKIVDKCTEKYQIFERGWCAALKWVKTKRTKAEVIKKELEE